MRAIIILVPESQDSDSHSEDSESIRSKSATTNYMDGWERIFGKPQEQASADKKNLN